MKHNLFQFLPNKGLYEMKMAHILLKDLQGVVYLFFLFLLA